MTKATLKHGILVSFLEAEMDGYCGSRERKARNSFEKF